MGVQKTIISEGNGPSPKQGDRVTMEYVSLQL
jgi:FK506-binding protein 1